MRPLPRTLAAVLLVALGGCSSMSIRTDFDPEFDFAGLRTYGWKSPPKEGDPRADNDLLDARVMRAVDDALTSKGYEKVEGDADFRVTYAVGLESKIDVRTIDRGYPGYRGRGWGYGYTETRVTEYEQGTLMLDVLGGSSGELVWRGSASARVGRSKTPEERERRIREAVGKILEGFPPR